MHASGAHFAELDRLVAQQEQIPDPPGWKLLLAYFAQSVKRL
jgi:hypothetical protein